MSDQTDTTAPDRRIIVTDIPDEITDALLPGVRRQHINATRLEFDEFDGAAGTNTVVWVDAATADRWDAGILECRRLGLTERSREGLRIRHRMMHGTDVLPARLAAALDVQETADAERRHDEADVEHRRARVAGLLDGWEVVDDQEVTRNLGDDITVLVDGDDDPWLVELIDGRRATPNGNPRLAGWKVWSDAPSAIAEARRRQGITGWQFSAEASDAMRSLPLTALRTGVFTVSLPDENGVEPAFVKDSIKSTGSEHAASIAELLGRVADEKPEHAEQIREVIEAITAPGAVVEITRGRGRPRIGERVELQVPDDMLAQIDARATAEGVPRAEMLRRLLAAALDA